MDKFIVMSLEEEDSKQLAKVLSNETALKILNKLAEKRHSPTELAKQLGMPISTIQYNLDLLNKSGMIKETAYRYSEKGKKVPYYEPVKKMIVIAPEGEKPSVLNLLKDKFLIPISLGITALLGFGAQYLFAGNQQAMQETKEVAAVAGAQVVASTVTYQITPFYQQLWFIFFLGGLLALVILLSLNYVKNKIRR